MPCAAALLALGMLLGASGAQARVAPASVAPTPVAPTSERATGTQGGASIAWPLAYLGKSSNAFIWDKRTPAMVKQLVPAALSGQLLDALGGPPDPVTVAGERYVSVAACRSYSCDEKGFLWMDTRTGVGLGAFHVGEALLLGSTGTSANTIPEPARRDLNAWLSEHDLRTVSVEFIERSGRRIKLGAGQFTGPAKFRPPSTGPAFDCARASGTIETAICSDSALAEQDLALGTLYARIWQGTDTTVARAQLRDLQRNWLRKRDRDCAGAKELAACLSAHYKAQIDRLSNWIPTPPDVKPSP